MATFKHPFEGSSLQSLVKRILRGEFVPVPSTYSAPVRDLVTVMLLQKPGARPSFLTILQMPFLRPYVLVCAKRCNERGRALPMIEDIIAPENPQPSLALFAPPAMPSAQRPGSGGAAKPPAIAISAKPLMPGRPAPTAGAVATTSARAQSPSIPTARSPAVESVPAPQPPPSTRPPSAGSGASPLVRVPSALSNRPPSSGAPPAPRASSAAKGQSAPASAPAMGIAAAIPAIVSRPPGPVSVAHIAPAVRPMEAAAERPAPVHALDKPSTPPRLSGVPARIADADVVSGGRGCAGGAEASDDELHRIADVLLPHGLCDPSAYAAAGGAVARALHLEGAPRHGGGKSAEDSDDEIEAKWVSADDESGAQLLHNTLAPLRAGGEIGGGDARAGEHFGVLFGHELPPAAAGEERDPLP